MDLSKITGIKYTGPVFDSSGYGEACRQYILALHSFGIPLTIEPVSFDESHPELGEVGLLLKSLVNRNIKYNFKIIHLTPEHFPIYKEPNVVNVGYSVWETSKLYKTWPGYINDNMDVQITSCDWNVEVFKNSGVKIPVFKVPHGINLDEFNDIEDFSISGLTGNEFVFYSIFQFTERKHPAGLLKAYWATFNKNDNVVLVLKTYRSNFSEAEKDAIRVTIRRLKQVMPMDHYPKVLLISDLLSRNEILGLHKRGDCFVLLHRGEGFGIPIMEAGACGNPVITTDFTGNCEFTKPDNSYLVNATWTPVFGMAWIPWYSGGDQWWLEPDLKHASDLMRHVYENQKEAREKGLKLKEYIKSNLSWETVGKRFVEVLLSC